MPGRSTVAPFNCFHVFIHPSHTNKCIASKQVPPHTSGLPASSHWQMRPQWPREKMETCEGHIEQMVSTHQITHTRQSHSRTLKHKEPAPRQKSGWKSSDSTTGSGWFVSTIGGSHGQVWGTASISTNVNVQVSCTSSFTHKWIHCDVIYKHPNVHLKQ